MKILKEGKPDRIGSFRCTNCGSLIEAKSSEAYRTASTYRGNYLYFYCPVCKHPAGIELNNFINRKAER